MSKVVSTDSHVMEPPDLWTGRIARAFADRGPGETNGLVDLKANIGVPIDLVNAVIGNTSPPLVIGDVVVIPGRTVSFAERRVVPALGAASGSSRARQNAPRKSSAATLVATLFGVAPLRLRTRISSGRSREETIILDSKFPWKP